MVISKSRSYYTAVEVYHELAEASHADQMFDADLISGFIGNGCVLDVGAGSGFNAQLLSIPPHRYVASDLSRIGLQQVVEKGRGFANVCDAGRLPFRDKAFGTILCSWSLEHFEDPACVLEEMLRVVKPGGRVIIWGPNWDNIFRKDFPQFAHKSRWMVECVRWTLVLRMVRNEILPFEYAPYVNTDVAAFSDPARYISHDFDAVHAVLCQETVKFFDLHGCRTLFLADFSMMKRHARNDIFIRTVRRLLLPALPIIKRLPLVRWQVMRFPLVIEVPTIEVNIRQTGGS